MLASLAYTVWFVLDGGLERKIVSDLTDEYTKAHARGDRAVACAAASQIVSLQRKIGDAQAGRWQGLREAACTDATAAR